MRGNTLRRGRAIHVAFAQTRTLVGDDANSCSRTAPCKTSAGAYSKTAAGKAIKVVAPLLSQLPAPHSYRVIYMDRPIEEVVESQRKMIRNRGNQGSTEDPEKMRRLLSNFRDSTLRVLDRRKRFQPPIVSYPDLVRDREPWLDRIAEFLNGKVDPAAMAAAIRPSLHCHRM